MSMWDVVVLKFGSSVLRSAGDLPDVVDEIYRHLRAGKRVLAVVSALSGHTDRLLKEASAAFGDEAPEATAGYVATGESQAAAMLTGALLRAGVTARAVDPREVSLFVSGEVLNAEPKSVDHERIRAWFERYSVLVLPGFFGVDQRGEIALLGRGGSDYTALFLAQRLNAICHLVKNVHGIFDRDPALAGAHAHRFERLDWHTATSVAGRLVQSKALRFAELERLPFAVGGLSVAEETQVGAHSIHRARALGPSAPLGVTLLGLGTVGGGVYARLAAQKERFEIQRVIVQHPDKHRGAIPRELLSTDPWDAVHTSAELVIECMGGISPAKDVLLAALKAGKRVISANKTLFAEHWDEFAPFLHSVVPQARFSAAVGGALPVLEVLQRYASRVRSVRGIVNGTCNYILDALRKGIDFESAVEAAQAAGFAEADPTRDLSGADAADKLALMARVAFGVGLPQGSVSVRGIDAHTADPRIYLIAAVTRSGSDFLASVAPQELAADDFLAGARAAQNRVEIQLDDGQFLRIGGAGAGRWPTTTSVCGDALQFWREHCAELHEATLSRHIA